MRATVIYGAGDVRVEDVPDPTLQEPTDAVVRVLRSCICGSDLWPYGSMPASERGPADRARVPRRRGGRRRRGVRAQGRRCRGGAVRVGGQHLRLLPGGPADLLPARRAGAPGVDGGQGEAVRVPQAQGTLVTLPVGEDAALLPSLLSLSDVFPTGHHCAVTAGVNPRTTVTVIGDGAVGLCAVLAAKRLGAEQIILMGRHKDRTDLGREFGATDVVAERGEEGVEKVRELTGGDGTHTVLECVGTAAGGRDRATPWSAPAA